MGSQDKFGASDAKGFNGARMQYAALCWRRQQDHVQVLLITSRDTGRWVIPKGWPMPGLAPEAAAAQEAWEEAGVKGRVNPVCLGRYGYIKELGSEATVPCAVVVYGMQVVDLATKYPEAKERRREWFALADAAEQVGEPDLKRLIGGFVPPAEGRPLPIGADPDEVGRGKRPRKDGR